MMTDALREEEEGEIVFARCWEIWKAGQYPDEFIKMDAEELKRELGI